MDDLDALVITRLEHHLLEEFPPPHRDRLLVLFLCLDKLSKSIQLRHLPQHVVGKRDTPALQQFAKDLAQWVRHAVATLDDEQRRQLDALLATRGVRLGSPGRDTVGRSTYFLFTPQGKFPLDATG